MKIGVDFDNTIAWYDHVFLAEATRSGLLPDGFRGAKKEVRDAIRLLDDGELKWQTLQGVVYGQKMHDAYMFPGVADFFRTCRVEGIPVYIVSQKTRFNRYDPMRIDLREKAKKWMKLNAFFDPADIALREDRVYFETNRAKKVERIEALGLTHFIDDLLEVFEEPGFPDDTSRLLFAPLKGQYRRAPVPVYRSWDDITRAVFR